MKLKNFRLLLLAIPMMSIHYFLKLLFYKVRKSI